MAHMLRLKLRAGSNTDSGRVWIDRGWTFVLGFRRYDEHPHYEHSDCNKFFTEKERESHGSNRGCVLSFGFVAYLSLRGCVKRWKTKCKRSDLM